MDRSILISPRLPARLDVRQAAQLLGFPEHDIPILVKARLLKPLGNPVSNAPKFFAGCDLLEKSCDPAWLDKATKAVSEHWRCRNARRNVTLLKPGSESPAS